MEPSRSFATTGEDLSGYFHQTRAFPVLSADAEQALCYRWRDHHDTHAANQLVGSQLRLIAKTSRLCRCYGLPSEDIIGEGHIGIMRALCRFDPDRGVRFATYAVWWIRVAIQDYILRNWSMVTMGTTASQKKLLFNSRRMRARLQAFEEGELRLEQVSKTTTMLHAPDHEVISMDRRMVANDQSLDAPTYLYNAIDRQSGLIDDRGWRRVLLSSGR